MGEQTAMGPPLTALQYDLVYNMISFGLASMMASTVFFFLRLSSFAERYKAALCFTGLVTLIAMYHYMPSSTPSKPRTHLAKSPTVRSTQTSATQPNTDTPPLVLLSTTPTDMSTGSSPSLCSSSRSCS